MDKTEDQLLVKSTSASNAESPSFESAQASLQPPTFQLQSSDSSGEEQEIQQVSEQAYQLAAEDSTPPSDSSESSGSSGGTSGPPNNNEEFKPNNTGLPTQLKSGVENLSGFSLDDVKVHYNSDKPAQLQAHAYAQGTDIHLASGQEKHLPHEAWHVVQQKQGRVQPTTQLKAFNINDDAGLEKEADVMGAKAMQLKGHSDNTSNFNSGRVNGNLTVQLVRNPFTRFYNFVKRKNDKKLSSPLTPVGGSDANSANEVFKAKTRGPVGKSGPASGFAKKSSKKGDVLSHLPSAMAQIGYQEGFENHDLQNEGVGFHTITEEGSNDTKYKLDQDPRLVARQVISSRLDKKLGINVLSAEIFSQDEKGKTIGISGQVAGDQVRKTKDRPQWDPQAEDDPTYNVYDDFDYSNPETQKGLSNLMLMDSLTNQQDRHMGNMFIDKKTGNVKGIDNDASFTRKKKSRAYDLPGNPLVDGFYKRGANLSNEFSHNEDGSLRYNQTLIDQEAGEALLKMSEEDLVKILKGRDSDPKNERLDELEINNTLGRFRAMKARIMELKMENELGLGGGLVEEWNDETYERARNEIGVSSTGTKEYGNYIARNEDEKKNNTQNRDSGWSGEFE
jgi:hypothetical protein